MTDDPADISEYINYFERNPTPMWIYAQETQRFLRVNPAAVTQYGYTEDEFLAMGIQDLQPPGESSSQEKSFVQFFAGQDKKGTWRHRKKSGEVIVVELVSLPLKYRGQAAYIVMAHDITKYLLLDRENSDVMADAAHEMRTPLTAIMGFADLLTSQKNLPPDTQRQFLSRIYASGQRLKELLNDILDRSQPEPRDEPIIHRERCRAGVMIKTTLATFRHAVPGVRFSPEEPPQELVLFVDKAKVTQVLFTLIGSVIKLGFQEPIRVFWGLVNGEFIVSVSGSTQNSHQRGELEFTLSEWIAAAHGGRVWVEETTQGVVVKLAIPTGFEYQGYQEDSIKNE